MLSKTEFNKRFSLAMEKERNRLGYTQEEMALKLQMSLSGYKKKISGDTQTIDLYTAHLMYQITGRFLFELVEDSSPFQELVHNLHMLSPSQINFIKNITEFELNVKGKHKVPNDYLTVFIPTGNFDDGMFFDSSNLELVNVSSYRQKYGSLLSCGIRVTSNHLHPVYNMGDILLICQKAPRDGDTGIFINKKDGCLYIRKFHQTSPCLLEPVNSVGQYLTIDSYNREDMEQWVIFGYVITKIRE